MIGKNISHYKILEKLGEGGMGVVYKGEDTKLKREVALKFLPTNALQGKEEKERFTREAQAAAALNHVNIAHIYAIEEFDGQMFIAMEYIEGKSLAEMVSVPLPLEKAIDTATQIAAGLQAAHEKGMVHRDIKSANIMVTDKGVVKIMDFGLAKLANRSKMTIQGSTLGTATYMSPEQSRGEETDNRADIWSLGVVLYEMISGQLPFKGDYEEAVIYSILNEDPEPLTALRTGVPVALDGIVAKALTKDPDTRYQHVDELPADLKMIDATYVSRSRISAQMVQTKSKDKNGRWLAWGVSTVLLLAFLVLSFIHFRETSEEAQPVRFTIPFPESLTSVGPPSISPDGRKIAFTGTDSSGVTSIWIRPLDALEAVPVAGTDDVFLIKFWSPDSRFILYSNSKNRLKKILAAGGTAETILEIPDGSWGLSGSWGKDGAILYDLIPSSEGICQVPATGGTPVRVTTIDTAKGEIGHKWPRFLPDGRHFLYTVDTEDKPDIYVGSLDSGEENLLLSGAGFATYVASGYLWYLRDRTFMVQPFDPKSQELLHEPVPVFDADLNSIGVSESEVMVYHQSERRLQLVWFDRRGNRLREIGEEGRYSQIALSPDKKRLAVEIGAANWEADIWIVDLDRAVFSRFTTGYDPVWSPDSRRLLFTSDFNLLVKNLQGGEEEMLLDTPELAFAEDWTQDGRYALCHVVKSGLNAVWAVPLSGDREPISVFEGPFMCDEPRVSPDGRWLAYTANETGRYEIYVQPFLAAGERIRISGDGGGQPRWRKDGKEAFYLALDGTLMAVDIEGGDNLKPGIPKPLFNVPVTVNPLLDQFVVTGDGQRFLVITEVEVAPSPFQVILNWPEVLLKK